MRSSSGGRGGVGVCDWLNPTTKGICYDFADKEGGGISFMPTLQRYVFVCVITGYICLCDIWIVDTYDLEHPSTSSFAPSGMNITNIKIDQNVQQAVRLYEIISEILTDMPLPRCPLLIPPMVKGVCNYIYFYRIYWKNCMKNYAPLYNYLIIFLKFVLVTFLT